MKIIITGASGFVGINLSNYLQNKNYIVHPLSLRTTKWKEEINYTADAIIHLAGKAHDTKNISDASEYFQVNTNLTKELFDWYLNSNVKDFIYFSSVKAVADVVKNVLVENVEGKPSTPYGQSKFRAEEYILSQNLPIDKRVFIIRPCMIHGPGNKGNLNLLYNIVKKRVPWPLGSYQNKRSFLSIDNLLFIISKILEGAIPPGIYNVADDKPLSTNRLVELIGKAHGRNAVVWNIPKALVSLTAYIGNFLHLPLNEDRLQKLTENYIVSNKKIMSFIDEPLPISAEDGIINTIESFINHK